MIKSKIVSKVSNKIHKIKNIELYDDCSPLLVKNKDLVSEVQKYYLIKKNQTKNTKINRGLIEKNINQVLFQQLKK